MVLPQCIRCNVDMPGWREIGNFVIYDRVPRETGLMPQVRMMEHWETPVIKAICEHFKYDRLHMDTEVSNEKADTFKRGIVDNAKDNGWPIMTYGQPMTLGFLIVRPEYPIAHIDLMGVHPEHRGRKIGTCLLTHFLCWAIENGFDLCRAGTMEANSPACCLYESAGFKQVDCLRVFHK
ncbi:hypothetical protein LCGC14_0787980 [marine sediment metagenome]|uniref:N-acetyltransferase domain-containing protein n=1 Tax=marine sediment metagenome TaxID=412755 RepID=A0A0F9T0L4_9ZZZZ